MNRPTKSLMLDNLISQLLNGISDLPGWKAQSRLSSSRFKQSNFIPKKNSRQAGVLAIILNSEPDNPKLLFIKRTTKQNDKHSGQISFPGGQFETEDITLLNCALRETNEEVGLQVNDLQVLGPLSQLYVSVSDFIVQPYLAVYDRVPSFILEEEEVAKVIEYPIKALLKEDAVQYRDLDIRGHKLKDIPYFDLYGETLWGATAMITSEILYLINKP